MPGPQVVEHEESPRRTQSAHESGQKPSTALRRREHSEQLAHWPRVSQYAPSPKNSSQTFNPVSGSMSVVELQSWTDCAPHCVAERSNRKANTTPPQGKGVPPIEFFAFCSLFGCKKHFQWISFGRKGCGTTPDGQDCLWVCGLL